MLEEFLIILFTIIIYEIIVLTKILKFFENCFLLLRFLLNTIKNSEMSDDKKQRELLKNSKLLFAESFKIILFFLTVIILISMSQEFLNYVLTFKVIFISFVSIIIYNFIKKNIYGKL